MGAEILLVMSTISLKITLPELSTGQAIALWEAIHQVADAIWDAHGDAMGQVFAQEALLQPDPDDWCDPASDPDDDVPF
jgi:hypothetical protein